jgi:hypothetical protein
MFGHKLFIFHCSFLSPGFEKEFLSSFSLDVAPFSPSLSHQGFQIHEIGDQAWNIEAS